MLLVGCSRWLPRGGGKTTHRALVVHDVVERGEKWCGGGRLLSSPQLWIASARPGPSNGATVCTRGGRAWRHSGRRRCHCCGNRWEIGTSQPGSNPFAVSVRMEKSVSKSRVASSRRGSHGIFCRRSATRCQSLPARPAPFV